jgi:hypothetical protein
LKDNFVEKNSLKGRWGYAKEMVPNFHPRVQFVSVQTKERP